MCGEPITSINGNFQIRCYNEDCDRDIGISIIGSYEDAVMVWNNRVKLAEENNQNIIKSLT
jgi:hypothetical protein